MSDTVKSKYALTAEFLVKNQAALAALLPVGMDAGRFMRTVLNATLRTPALLDADRQSLFLAVLALGEMGLEPAAGQGHLVPFKTKVKTAQGEVYKTLVQAIPGYGGLVRLAFNSGQVKSVMAEVVREGDEFNFRLGLDPKLDHVPAGASANVTHAYAVVHYRDGGHHFVVMTRTEVDAIMKRAKGSDGAKSPWKTDYAEMAKKTVLKRAMKMVPKSSQLDAALFHDGRSERGGSALPLAAELPEDLLASVVEPDAPDAEPETKAAPWAGKDTPAPDAPTPENSALVEDLKKKGLL